MIGSAAHAPRPPSAGRDLYGVHYLVGDYREVCYGGRHNAHMAVAALFVAAFPIGIAAGFWGVLRWFRVPQIAAAKERAAALRASPTPTPCARSRPCAPVASLRYLQLQLGYHLARHFQALSSASIGGMILNLTLMSHATFRLSLIP